MQPRLLGQAARLRDGRGRASAGESPMVGKDEQYLQYEPGRETSRGAVQQDAEHLHGGRRAGGARAGGEEEEVPGTCDRPPVRRRIMC